MIITDKQVKQILRNLAAIGVQAPGGLAITDIGMTVRFVNPMWAAMHGYNTTDELVGKHISIFHTKDQMETDVIPLMEEVKHRDQLTGLVEHIRSEGTVFVTNTRIISAKDEDGNVIAFVVFAMDTTKNNSGYQCLTGLDAASIAVTNDKLQQQMPEQGIESDFQVIEEIADIESECEKQLENVKAEIEQAIPEQSNKADEKGKTYNGEIAKKDVETAGEKTNLRAEPEEAAICAKDIEHVQLQPELQKRPGDQAETRAAFQSEQKEYDEKLPEAKDKINAAREVERMANATSELKVKCQDIEKTWIYTPLRQQETEQALSDTAVKDRPGEISLKDVCCVFFRHKWKMVSFFFTVVTIVAVVTYLSADVYYSEAKLLLRLGRESVTLDPTAATGQLVPVSQSRENEINSELEVLKSRELVEKVVDSVGTQKLLEYPDEKHPAENSGVHTVVNGLKNLLNRFNIAESLSDRDKTVLKVMKNLKIEHVKDSEILSIAYKAKSPKLAQEVVSKFVDLHLEKHIAVHRTLGSQQFFAEQANHLQDKLMRSENELRDFKNEVGVSSVSEQQHVVLTRIATLKQEIDQAEAALATSVATVDALQRAIAGVPETVVTEATTGFPNFRSDELRKQIYTRQLDELKLLTSFTEESGAVKAIRQEIAAAQALLDKEEPNRTQVTRGLSKTHEQLQAALLTEQANISSLRAKVDIQRKQLVDVQAEVKRLNDAEAKVAILTREANIQEASYRKYSENLEQARINYAMESERISNISVVQAATLPTNAARSRKLVNLALGFFLGIFGAIVFAIFSEHLDHSIKTPAEAEEMLQLPALASIPCARVGRAFPIVKLRKQGKPSDKNVGQMPAKLEIPAKIRESYEAFRERLLPHSNGTMDAPYVLAIIGCQRHQGVSAVAANFAAALSRHYKNGHVLLVDANLKYPCVHKVFNTKLSPGLTDILANGQNSVDTIQSVPTQNMDILSAGTLNGDLFKDFDSNRFTELLNSMKEHYRFVVVDLPALSEASSAARLASLCDGAVLVIEAERLRREIMQRAKVRLLECDVNLLGVVLNKRRFHIPGWLYRRL
jgi:capsular exopolysaccharide synthesis family protein